MAERGIVQGRNYSIYGSMFEGLAGPAALQIQLSDLNYQAESQQKNIHTDDVLLTVYKNQNFLGPITYQLGWKVSGFDETRSIDRQISRLHIGDQHYDILIGGVQDNRLISDLWTGKSMQSAVLGSDGAGVQNLLDKAKAIEVNYNLGEFAYKDRSLAYNIGDFSLKYQSKICGGCEGRFDIGFDKATSSAPKEWQWLDILWPERSYASGTIKGVALGQLLGSRDAFINPFDSGLVSCPNLARLKSFSIPDFKFSAYDESTDIGGSGSIDARYDERYVINGKIKINLKKGSQKIHYFLSRVPSGNKSTPLGKFLKLAFISGDDKPDGSTDFVVDIKDNALSVNGFKIAADAELSDLIVGLQSTCRWSPTAD